MTAAIATLGLALEQTRTSENQYRDNEEHYMDLALAARSSREKYATRAAELERAIAALEEVAT